MLTHEATHLYFSKKENPHFATDHGGLERAVRRLASSFEALLSSTDQRGLPLQVLKYMCSLFVEICQCNYERPIAKQAGIAPRPLLHLFESSASIMSTLKLFDKALAMLLECAQEECFNILMDGSQQGFCFDWVWLHVAASFPGPVMSFLLKMGAEEFKQYALTIASHEQQGNQAAAFETHQLYKQKFMPLAETFTYLASKRNAELSCVTREMLIKGIERLENGDGAALTNTADLSVPFLFKMVASSPDVLRFLVQHASELVKSSVILKACIQMSQISKHCILPVVPGVAHTYTAFLKQFLCFLNVEAIASLLDTALPFAFDEHVFDQLSPPNQQLSIAVRDGAVELVNEIVSIITSSAHSQPLFAINENDVLGRCAIDSLKLKEYVAGAMCGGERGKFNIRFLYAFCVAAGPMKTYEVIVRFILDAKDKQEVLKGLATAIICLFFAGLAMEAVDADTSINVTWIENLKTLNEWQKTASEEHPFKYIRFEMTRLYGQLMTYLLGWTRDELDRIENDANITNASERDEIRTNVMLTVIGFSTSIGPPPVLKPRLAYKLCAQFASLLITLLKFAGDDEQSDSFSLFISACGPVVQFLDSQAVYVREQFATHFIDEAFSRAQEIFGGSSVDVWENDVWSKNNGNAGRGDLEGAMKQMNVREDFGESLFDRARKIPIGKWNPSDMANCGLIGKGIRRVQKVKLQARYYVFSSYCMGWFMERLVKKKLLMAITLTDRICKEGLAWSFVWGEWELEREAAHRLASLDLETFIIIRSALYIAVANTVSDVCFVWSMMSAIAEVHPCLWYCIPLLKAVLASVMIQFENSPSQKSSPPKKLLDTLDRWFLLARKGKVLPAQMTIFFDVITGVTYREGFLILLDLWRYFQSVVNMHTITAFNEALERSSGVAPLKPIKVLFKFSFF
ncbi:unnamed protein product [Toxocara canis]|uniref:Non-specific serine/threonine protein kinase n=1 Tax=Toxocara canis TaxID=6265 RepID=A0A183V1R3_TOXCA|nr:unnamed protein product [Toxocara canis]